MGASSSYIPPFSGGSAIDLAEQAWIEPTEGSDITGTVGDPAFPYATIQAAYDDGAFYFNIGEGDTGSLIIGTNATISIVGKGFQVSVIPSIQISGILILTDTGGRSVNCASIIANEISLFNVGFVTVNSSGGPLNIFSCEGTTANSSGTNGIDGDGSNPGTDGTNAGNITINNSIVAAVVNKPGLGGADGGAGAGNNGTSGQLTLLYSKIAYIDGGISSTGNFKHSIVEDILTDDIQLTSSFSNVEGATITLVDVVASFIDGTFYSEYP